MKKDEIKTAIKFEEGLRLDIYKDSRGFLTVGYGHLLVEGATIPYAAAEIIFDADYNQAIFDYAKLKLNLDIVRRSAVIDMLFNMGLPKVLKFKKFLANLHEEKWIDAANELMDSNYARQVPNRASRNKNKILHGEFK